jgi:glyoxylase-like metal-dependent hydrolase (beta-lactamase superfamily II)
LPRRPQAHPGGFSNPRGSQTNFQGQRTLEVFLSLFIPLYFWLNIPMTIHVLNCFTDNARWPSKLKTGMVCLLVETNQGLVLLDTGLGLDDYSHPTWMTRLLRVITVMPFDPNEAAVNRIKQLGCRVEDVKHIFLTHMHFDHISGLPDFPQAKVHVHRREYEAFTEGKIRQFTEYAYIPRYIAHKPEFILYDKIDSKWYDFDAIRLPFEPEMYFIPLHGHSRGHCGVAIKTSEGWLFHAGDAGAVYNNETPAWLIKLVLGPHDPLLRRFMKAHPEVLLTNSHMYPEFFAQHITIR